MSSSGPTAFPDLNTVLREFVATTRAILGENFRGAYLQGSFALGDADAHSDVDFIVVVHDAITPDQEAGLRAMHARFPTLDIEWARHVEGSYIPMAALRRLDPARAPYLYVDNGSPDMEWSNHDNTAVVRWVLREHGVRLAGPDPASLVDEVSADELRDEARRAMGERARDLREWMEATDEPWSAWLQTHVVITNCRMLYTLSSGRVTSKPAAGQWALGTLEPQWAPLIQQALDDRPDPWLRVHQPADPALVAETWRFIAFALRVAETMAS